MTDTKRVINDLNAAKLILCTPKMITPEMCIKVGQAIESAIDLLKELDERIIKFKLERLKEMEEQIKKFELERSWDEHPDTMGKW